MTSRRYLLQASFRQHAAVTALAASCLAAQPALAQETVPIERAETGVRAQVEQPTSAQGGSPSAQEDEINEIIVTATLRRTRLQETPIAVTAFSPEQLRANFLNKVDDLAVFAPNVTVAGRRSAASAPFIIRGIGANVVGFGLDDPIAQYVDGVYLGRPASGSTNFSDVERIEVLRGPQGTLRGRNSTGGAISITTKRPTTENLEGDLDGEVGRYGVARIRGSLNLPLSDKIAFRGGFYHASDKGRSYNFVTADRTDLDRGSALRGSLIFKPDDDTNILLIGDYAFRAQDYGFDAIPFTQIVEDNNPGNPLSDDLYQNNQPSGTRVRTGGLNLTIERALTEALSFTSITAWRRYRSYSIVDADASIPSVIASFPASQGANNLDQATRERQTQVSQEIRFAYDDDGPINVIGGGYFFTEKINAGQDLGIRAVVPAFLVGVIPGLKVNDILRSYIGSYRNTAFAFFGQVDYDVLPRLTASVGARASIEQRTADATQQVPAGFFSSTPLTGQLLFSQNVKVSYSDFSPSFGLNYKFSHDLFGYVRASRAFKSGGFNQTLAQAPFGAENLWAYEAGLKATFGRALRFNTAAFYYDYQNLQSTVPGPLPNTTRIENAGSAEIYGLELEGTLKPIHGLQIDGSVGYLHATYKDYLSTFGNLSGYRLGGAPRFQWNLNAQFEIPLGAWATLTPRGQIKHEGSTYFTPENDLRFSHRPFTQYNAYLTLEAVDHSWFLRGYLENLTNERYLTTAQVRDPITCFCRASSGFRYFLQSGVRF